MSLQSDGMQLETQFSWRRKSFMGLLKGCRCYKTLRTSVLDCYIIRVCLLCNCGWFCGREFKLNCRGVGVHPPLQLSYQVLHFKSTALFDMSTASVFVVNSHLDQHEYKHAVPRIGTGECHVVDCCLLG